MSVGVNDSSGSEAPHVVMSQTCVSPSLPFPSRMTRSPHISTRQYARIVKSWVARIGLDPGDYGTHSLRRTKVTVIYKRTKNLRAVQLLLGHTKLEAQSDICIEVDDTHLRRMALAVEEDKRANPENVGFLGTGREVAAPADKAHLIQEAGLFGSGWLHGQVLLWGKTTCSTSECVNDRRVRSSRFG